MGSSLCLFSAFARVQSTASLMRRRAIKSAWHQLGRCDKLITGTTCSLQGHLARVKRPGQPPPMKVKSHSMERPWAKTFLDIAPCVHLASSASSGSERQDFKSPKPSPALSLTSSDCDFTSASEVRMAEGTSGGASPHCLPGCP